MADNDFKALLASPDVRRFVLAGFVGRMQMSMLGIATILLVTSATGSYALAGAVGATILVSQAFAAPRIGRLGDRYGQGRVLRPVVLLHALGLAGIMAGVATGAVWLLFLSAVCAGLAFPPLGPMVRARWTALVGGTPQLKTAFSVEGAIDEVIYIVGPVLATMLAAALHPAAGFVAGLVLTVAGGLAYAAMRRTEPPLATEHRREPSLLRVSGLRLVLVFGLALGVILGSVEISMVAFTEDLGRPALAGPFVAALSVGSLVTGLLYGSRQWTAPLAQRFLACSACLAVGLLPLVVTTGLPLMALSAFVAGAAIAPTLIVMYEIVETLVPAARSSEGFAWVQSALVIGLAAGVSLSGQVTDALDGHHAFRVTAAAGAVALVMAALYVRLGQGVRRAEAVLVK
ncbi:MULTISPECIES: MFS transporter [Streptosporangium]|uniref:MFS family permease n=1 Tax=Streptosporangium brasiliense TaxID=47480 RepID=A0ABT9QWQ2_9ACTN|nr:MFS transporter [Streptosporangium brasiliense]MDP9861406.1 MFS family permease [Streptosporangium brasiliense]